MIADSNPEPATVTFDPIDGTVDLECAVDVPDQFSCDVDPSITLDFTQATVMNTNLAGYNSLQSGDPGVPDGIYYGEVGYWGYQQLGLRIQTPTPGVYRCHYSHNEENKCERVMTDEGFGQINMFSGDVRLNFQLTKEDGTNGGTPLADGETIPKVVMSIFDIDSGFDFGEEVEILNPVKVCPGGVAELTNPPYYIEVDDPVNSLDFTQNDFTSPNGYAWNIFSGCWESRADPPNNVFTVKQRSNCAEGACKDNNPEGPNTLTQGQRLRSIEVEYQDVTSAGFDITFLVSRKHTKSRNIMFSGPSRDLGRKCCKDVFSVFDCPGGYKNANQQCGTGVDGVERCTKENCCIVSTGHGDPIIHTFHEECYDLHKDGNWLASSHSDYDYDVHVGVYNEYMRQISVTAKDGSLLFSVNNFGEIINNDYTGFREVKTVPCPEDYEGHDCIDEYINVSFDAQDLYYDVHVGLRHDYADPSLKNGAVGYHMDIYPQPYTRRFTPRLHEYKGLYFHNPMPEAMPTCENR